MRPYAPRPRTGGSELRSRLAAAALAAVVSACGGPTTDDASTSEHGVTHAVAAGEPAEPAEAERTIDVLAYDDLSFDPSTIEVRVGEVVTFEVSNMGRTTHEFVLGDERTQEEHAAAMTASSHDAHAHHQDNAVTVRPGETKQLTWRFTRAGHLLAGCHEPGHYAGGMVATINVTS